MGNPTARPTIKAQMQRGSCLVKAGFQTKERKKKYYWWREEGGSKCKSVSTAGAVRLTHSCCLKRPGALGIGRGVTASNPPTEAESEASRRAKEAAAEALKGVRR